MRFLLTLLVCAAVYGVLQWLLGENVMFWLSLAWLLGLLGFTVAGRLRR